MAKWADYLISAVRYNTEKTHIVKVKVHKDMGESVGSAEEFTRGQVADKIEKGYSFVTIYRQNEKWVKGEEVHTVTVDGEEFIRTDRNNIKKDNLGALPEL